MAESKLINDNDTYVGVYPSVFKKIDKSDISINPFQVYKQWTVPSGSTTSSMLTLQGIYNSKKLPALGSELTFNDSANIDGSLQTVTYYAINHMFYKYKDEPYKTYGPTDLTRINKYLYQTASIFSIPQKKFGETIKPGSFVINHPNYTLKSDRYGNLYDEDIDANAFASVVAGQPKWYEGFNEYFDESRIKYISAGVTYVPGVPDSDVESDPIGLAAKFDGAGYIESKLNGLYDRDHDYAVSFWISASNSGTNKLILAKASSSLTPQYPFKIEYSGSNQIVFSAAGSTSFKVQITSSVLSDWSHVCCQKSGSNLQIFVNGGINASASFSLLTNTLSPFTASARIDNSDNLYIGGFGTNSFNFTGCLDEIRIYNKAIPEDFVGGLSKDTCRDGLFLQSNNFGNVFSKQGIAVVSTPDNRMKNIINEFTDISYKSTVTIHELDVVARLDSGDFNMSTNLTLTQDDDSTYLSFVSGSDFSPYITTIGLYNDAGELLAIGKLAQPIKKRNDVDMNFLIRLDLDKNIVKE
jgi:hypothetical protein